MSWPTDFPCPNVQVTQSDQPATTRKSLTLTPLEEGGKMSFPPISITNSFTIETTSPLLFQEFSSLLPPLDQIRSPFSRSRMNGYTRIRKDSSGRSKSMDFAELTFQREHRTPSFFTSSHLSNATKITTKHSSIPEEGAGEVFGIILSQKHNVCSAQDKPAPAKQKGMGEEEGSPSSMKSSSVIRSSSMSQGYTRIPDHLGLSAKHSSKLFAAQNGYVKKKGRYIKAFLRVFGL